MAKPWRATMETDGIASYLFLRQGLIMLFLMVIVPLSTSASTSGAKVGIVIMTQGVRTSLFDSLKAPPGQELTKGYS